MSNDTPTGVYTAFAAAMRDIKAVGKDGKNTQQNYNFRGIDGVLNAVGPVFRDHGLFILPEVLDHNLTATPRQNKSPVISVIIKIRYTIVHEDGSSFSGVTVGEGNDYSDKATSKATSVALRTFLIQSLALPTHDRDPDEDSIERGAPQQSRPPSVPENWAEYVQGAEQSGNVKQLVTMRQQAVAAGDKYVAGAIGEAIDRLGRAQAERSTTEGE